MLNQISIFELIEKPFSKLSYGEIEELVEKQSAEYINRWSWHAIKSDFQELCSAVNRVTKQTGRAVEVKFVPRRTKGKYCGDSYMDGTKHIIEIPICSLGHKCLLDNRYLTSSYSFCDYRSEFCKSGKDGGVDGQTTQDESRM